MTDVELARMHRKITNQRRELKRLNAKLRHYAYVEQGWRCSPAAEIMVAEAHHEKEKEHARRRELERLVLALIKSEVDVAEMQRRAANVLARQWAYDGEPGRLGELVRAMPLADEVTYPGTEDEYEAGIGEALIRNVVDRGELLLVKREREWLLSVIEAGRELYERRYKKPVGFSLPDQCSNDGDWRKSGEVT